MPGLVLSDSFWLIHLIFPATLLGRYYFYPNFINKKPSTGKQITHPFSPNQSEVEMEFKAKLTPESILNQCFLLPFSVQESKQ